MNPTGRKWLVGTLAGCGVLLLVAVGSCVGFVAWLNSPGDLLEPARLIDSGTTGYVAWTLRLEDPATEEFFRTLLRAIDEMRSELPTPLPPALKGPLFGIWSQASEKKLRRAFPVVVAWTLAEGSAESADVELWSASLAGADHQLRLMDWIFGRLWGLGGADGHRVLYRDETIVAIPLKGRREPAGFFIHRGDLFVASDLDEARRAIDRLQAPVVRSAPMPTSVERWLERVPERPLRGGVDNGRGEIERLWRRLDPGVDAIVDPETWRSVEGLTIGGALEADGSFDAEVDLHFASTEVAASAAGPLGAAWTRLVEGTPFTLSKVEVDGARLRAVLEITNVAERLKHVTDRMFRPGNG